MLNSHWAVVHDGKIEIADAISLPEGTRVLITVLPETDEEFWRGASGVSLTAIWDNTEDDVYAQLLQA